MDLFRRAANILAAALNDNRVGAGGVFLFIGNSESDRMTIAADATERDTEVVTLPDCSG